MEPLPTQLMNDSSYGHLLTGSEGSYGIDVDSVIGNYISDFNDSVGIMILFVVFFFLYNYTIYPFLIDYFNRAPRLLWAFDRVRNVSRMLAQAGAMFILWVSWKQNILSGWIQIFLFTVIVFSVLIMLGSVMNWAYNKGMGD